MGITMQDAYEAVFSAEGQEELTKKAAEQAFEKRAMELVQVVEDIWPKLDEQQKEALAQQAEEFCKAAEEQAEAEVLAGEYHASGQFTGMGFDDYLKENGIDLQKLGHDVGELLQTLKALQPA